MSDDMAEVKRKLEYPNGAARDAEVARVKDRVTAKAARRNYGPLREEEEPDVLEMMNRNVSGWYEP